MGKLIIRDEKFPEIVEALTASCFESGSETVSPSS